MVCASSDVLKITSAIANNCVKALNGFDYETPNFKQVYKTYEFNNNYFDSYFECLELQGFY